MPLSRVIAYFQKVLATLMSKPTIFFCWFFRKAHSFWVKQATLIFQPPSLEIKKELVDLKRTNKITFFTCPFWSTVACPIFKNANFLPPGRFIRYECTVYRKCVCTCIHDSPKINCQHVIAVIIIESKMHCS